MSQFRSGMSGEPETAGGQLRAFVERIERIEEDIKDRNDDKSEVYKELRGLGFDVKTVRKCVAARKLDPADRAESDALFDLYWTELNKPLVHVHAREGNGSAADQSPEAAQETTGGTGDDCSFGNSGVWPPQGGESSSRALNDIGAEQVVTAGETAQDFEPVAFLRPAKPLRPHCLHPGDSCGGYGSKHCNPCLKAAGEVAA